MVVTASSSGFSFWIDGQLVGTSTSFTNAWTNNAQPIRFATAVWSGGIVLDMDIDEVALYSRVLSNAEIAALAQNTDPPVAANDSATVPESQTTAIDVTANDSYVGAKADLTVEIMGQGSLGTASVNGNNDIEYAAGAVDQDEADSLTYRIADANGTSNIATVSLTVQNASTAGGVLVYRWEPLASWIDGASLSNRDNNDVEQTSRWTGAGGASVGGSMFQGFFNIGGNRDYCFNRAPTGHPSLEIFAEAGKESNPINLSPILYDRMNQTPRHLRVVFEVKTCKTSDPTTHKGQGLGPTSGSYTDWRKTHEPGGVANVNCAVKYFIGLWGGIGPGGGGNDNWWNDHTFPIDRYGDRIQMSSGGKTPDIYNYSFDRPNRTGGSQNDYSPPVKMTDTGIHGTWHRIEVEVRLADPETVPDNARRSTTHVQPSGGNGYVKHFVTKNIDGESGQGPVGTRQEVAAHVGVIQFCKFDDVGSDDNMHILANLAGFWITNTYGGSAPTNQPQANGWSWIRKIEVYRHD